MDTKFTANIFRFNKKFLGYYLPTPINIPRPISSQLGCMLLPQFGQISTEPVDSPLPNPLGLV